VRTDASGRYFVTGLAAGSYRLTFERCPTAAGTHQASSSFLIDTVAPTRDVSVLPGLLQHVALVSLPALPVVVGRDGRPSLSTLLGRPVTVERAGAPSLRAPAGSVSKGAISGLVTTARGRPIGGICAIAVTRRGQGIEEATGTDGTYLIPVHAGTYEVFFQPGCGTLDNWFPAAYDNGALVVVTAGQTTSGIDVQLQLGGGLTGTVTGANTHALPPAEVCVTAVRQVANSVFIYTELGLGPGGTYDLASIEPGPWVVFFSGCAARINLAPQWWDDASSYQQATPVDVRAGPSVVGIDAAMTTGGEISGTVTGPAGTGLSGICASTSMQITSEVGLGFEYRSGNAGAYTIPGLDTGSFPVDFNAGCFSRANVAPTSLPAPVNVVAGQVTSGVDVTMTMGASISGTVRDSSGQRLAGICVLLGSTTGIVFVQPVATSFRGDYRIDQLPAGGYGVEFAPGCGNNGNYVTQFYDDQTSSSQFTLITLASGGTATGINAALQTGGILHGTVSAAAGGGVALACVLTSAVEQGFVGSEDGFLFAAAGVQTRRNGQFTITGLPTDRYDVYVDPTCGGQLPSASAAMYFGGGDTFPPPETVSVVAGQATADIDVTLPAGGSISGAVSPAVNGCVLLTDPTTKTLVAQDTPPIGPNGSYEIEGVLPGSYLVEFSTCNVVSKTAAQFYPDSPTTVHAQAVTVVGGQVTSGIDFNLQPTAVITGRVTTHLGHGASVCLFANSEPLSDGQGTIAFTRRNGSYTVEGIGTGTYALEFGACGRPAATAVAVVEHGKARQGAVTANVNAVLPEAGAVEGRVATASGSPLGGVCVFVQGAPGGLDANGAVTLPDGTYEILGVPAGSWKVQFQPACGIYGTWSTVRTGGVTVKARGTTTGIDAVLSPGGTIFGLVTGVSAKPLSQICVIAVPLATGPAEELATTSHGWYSIVGLQPGSYDVEFTNGCGNATAYTTQWWNDAASEADATPVTVASGLTTVGIDAQLQPST